MITIIHGDDVKASRDFLTQKKQESGSPMTLDGASLDVTQLTQALSGEGLFHEKSNIFIEQLLSKKKKSKELDAIIDVLNSNAEQAIFIWEGKLLEKKLLLHFPKSTERVFKLPQMLFTFLDNLKPNNARQLLPLYHNVLSTVEPEVLFAMITRQMRLLLSCKDSQDNPIDEVKRLQPWQVQKLKKQASLFPEEEIIEKYSSLHDIDYQFKTGRATLPLSSTIDIWLLKL